MGWQDAPVVAQPSATDGQAPKWAAAPVVGSAPAAEPPQPKSFNIDWTQPDEAIRGSIAKLPEADRQSAVDQWADAVVRRERQGGITPSSNWIAEGVRHFGRGTLAGSFLDEADAYINDALWNITGGRIGGPQQERLAYTRARSRAEDEAHPVAGTVAKLAGGLSSGAPVAKAVIGKAKSKLGKVGASGVVGGTAGAVYGFGEGEGNITDENSTRLSGAGTGAQIGTGLGVVAPVLLGGLGAAAQKAVDMAPGLKARLPISRVSDPEKVADSWLASKMRRSGTTPDDVAADLAKGESASRLHSNSLLGRNTGQKKMTPWSPESIKAADEAEAALLPEMIADTSDTMQRLTGSVYRTGNQAGEIVRDALETRQRGPVNPYAPRINEKPQGQLERMLDSYDRAMLIKTKGTARQNEKAILARQKAEGDALYVAARAKSEPFDITDPLAAFRVRMQDYPPDFANRLLNAARLFERPTKLKDGTILGHPVDNVTLFDNAKKSLDDMIEIGRRAGENNYVRELTELKNSLLAKVHEGGKNKVYQQARDTWGSEAENLAALDLGRKALREDSEVSAELFRELNEAQKKLFRIGLRESMRNALGPTRTGHDATKIFDTRRVQELLAESIPRPKGKNAVFSNRPEQFGEIVSREQRMTKTRNAALGNSATAQRHQDDAEFASDALASILTGGRSMLNYGLEFLGAGLQKAFGYRQDVATALAKRLVESDPVKRAEILRNISREMGPSKFAVFSKNLADKAALAATPTAVSGSVAEQ